MSKLTGVFDYFNNLDKIPVGDLSRWIKSKVNIITLHDFVGNRILYPQTVAFSKLDLEIDLAILKEGLTRNYQQFYDSTAKKITLPKIFLSRFPRSSELMAVIAQTIKVYSDFTTVYLSDSSGSMLVGSIYAPKDLDGLTSFGLEINGQKNQLKIGSLAVFPIYDKEVKLKTPSSSEIKVNGGILGLAIDLRKKS